MRLDIGASRSSRGIYSHVHRKNSHFSFYIRICTFFIGPFDNVTVHLFFCHYIHICTFYTLFTCFMCFYVSFSFVLFHSLVFLHCALTSTF